MLLQVTKFFKLNINKNITHINCVSCRCFFMKEKVLHLVCNTKFLLLLLSVCIKASAAAPSAIDSALVNDHDERVWPSMQHYNMWTIGRQEQDQETELEYSNDDVNTKGIEIQENFEYISDVKETKMAEANDRDKYRQNRVIHLFPVPVDGECLSNDGRRLGNCLNAYECRQKGGKGKGECAMGFGVCCIFVADCNTTITNNITYLVSPNFPSYMSNNISACQLKVKLLNADISQLRIDFYHFSLGQPNRRTGICDGDVFNISGGPSGTFSLCGQNSGQHIYYDVHGRVLARQTPLYGTLRPLTFKQIYPNQEDSINDTNMEQLIEITLHFTNRFLPKRLWEIRIAQIPFSLSAPAGCLQYFTSVDGIMQTFNFADNGRHLANQNYRICIRQEADMCSIIYQPCDEQSFRIGSSMDTIQPNMVGTGGANDLNISVTENMEALMNDLNSTTAIMADDANSDSDTTSNTVMTTNTTIHTTTAMTTLSSLTTAANIINAAMLGNSPTVATTTITSSATDIISSPANDDAEGSGDELYEAGSVITSAESGVSRRPHPENSSSGGFDILGFLRSAFDLHLHHRRHNRKQLNNLDKPEKSRQFFTSCTDRITMPCIIEDFIDTGLGLLPGCEPVHCGSNFCASGIWPCRVESTVTPFYISIHFGDGAGKGSPEDNIGACLRYTQMRCM